MLDGMCTKDHRCGGGSPHRPRLRISAMTPMPLYVAAIVLVWLPSLRILLFGHHSDAE